MRRFALVFLACAALGAVAVVLAGRATSAGPEPSAIRLVDPPQRPAGSRAPERATRERDPIDSRPDRTRRASADDDRDDAPPPPTPARPLGGGGDDDGAGDDDSDDGDADDGDGDSDDGDGDGDSDD